jgi:hypothetical protein
MKNKKPEDTLLQAVSDLYIRDIEKLLFVNKDYKKAGWVMSAIGMSKNDDLKHTLKKQRRLIK